MKWSPVLIITMAYLACVFTLLLLMGMEVIHNQAVIDRLLLTIPVTGAALVAYWFSKMGRPNGQNGPKNGDTKT